MSVLQNLGYIVSWILFQQRVPVLFPEKEFEIGAMFMPLYGPKHLFLEIIQSIAQGCWQSENSEECAQLLNQILNTGLILKIQSHYIQNVTVILKATFIPYVSYICKPQTN